MEARLDRLKEVEACFMAALDLWSAETLPAFYDISIPRELIVTILFAWKSLRSVYFYPKEG